MTKKIFGLVIPVIALVLGMTVVGCKGKSADAGKKEGTLIVENCPGNGSSSVIIIENTKPKIMTDLTDLLMKPSAAGIGSDSPFTLYNTGGKKFTETGLYLVVITANSNVYYAENTDFTNGCATIDFNNMKSMVDLPMW